MREDANGRENDKRQCVGEIESNRIRDTGKQEELTEVEAMD
jgi:hypothetical protein